jgi:FtsZ-binding cell division protein ZapB
MSTKAQLAATIEALRAEIDTLRLLQAQDAQRIADAQHALANAQHKPLIHVAHPSWQEQAEQRRAKMERAKAIAMASGKMVTA